MSLCCMLCACTKTVYVPVESAHTETSLHNSVDTVERFRDRVIETHDDTVYVTTTEVRYRSVYDTIYKEKVDTICTPVPVETRVEVERDLSWWQRVRISAFPWLCSAVGVFLIWTFRKYLI